MTNKKCGKCNKIKDIEEFSIRNRGKKKIRHRWCKQCVKIYDHQRWENGTKKLFNDKFKRKTIDKLYKYLQNKACADCGETNILTLEFDHVRGTKRNNISNMIILGASWKTILIEIDKCDIVCANCHRIRTAKRGNWRKLKY